MPSSTNQFAAWNFLTALAVNPPKFPSGTNRGIGVSLLFNAVCNAVTSVPRDPNFKMLICEPFH